MGLSALGVTVVAFILACVGCAAVISCFVGIIKIEKDTKRLEDQISLLTLAQRARFDTISDQLKDPVLVLPDSPIDFDELQKYKDTYLWIKWKDSKKVQPCNLVELHDTMIGVEFLGDDGITGVHESQVINGNVKFFYLGQPQVK